MNSIISIVDSAFRGISSGRRSFYNEMILNLPLLNVML